MESIEEDNSFTRRVKRYFLTRRQPGIGHQRCIFPAMSNFTADLSRKQPIGVLLLPANVRFSFLSRNVYVQLIPTSQLSFMWNRAKQKEVVNNKTRLLQYRGQFGFTEITETNVQASHAVIFNSTTNLAWGINVNKFYSGIISIKLFCNSSVPTFVGSNNLMAREVNMHYVTGQF